MLSIHAMIRIDTHLSTTISMLVVLLAGVPSSFARQSTAAVEAEQIACTQSSTEFDQKHKEASRLFKTGNLSDALRLYEAAYILCPGDYQNTHDLALAKFMGGDSDAAKTIIEVLLQTQDRAELHSLLGKIESTAMNYKGAAVQYQAAAKADPSEMKIFDYGMSLARLDYGAAIQVLRFGIDNYPNSVRLHVALGTALYVQGLTEEGAETLCRAEELDPSDPNPMEILAATEIVPPPLLQRVTNLFAGLRRKYPKDALVLFDYTLVKSGRWSGDQDVMPAHFADSMKAVLALNANLPQAYFQLSFAYARQEKYNDEIIALKKAVQLSPEKEEYHFRLASAYRKTGNQQGFDEEIGKFQEIHNRNSPNGH